MSTGLTLTMAVSIYEEKSMFGPHEAMQTSDTAYVNLHAAELWPGMTVSDWNGQIRTVRSVVNEDAYTTWVLFEGGKHRSYPSNALFNLLDQQDEITLNSGLPLKGLFIFLVGYLFGSRRAYANATRIQQGQKPMFLPEVQPFMMCHVRRTLNKIAHMEWLPLSVRGSAFHWANELLPPIKGDAYIVDGDDMGGYLWGTFDSEGNFVPVAEEFPLIKETDPELEALLDEEMWDVVAWSYDQYYNTSSQVGLIRTEDNIIGTVVDYNRETGMVKLLVDPGQSFEQFVETTISDIYGRF